MSSSPSRGKRRVKKSSSKRAASAATAASSSSDDDKPVDVRELANAPSASKKTGAAASSDDDDAPPRAASKGGRTNDDDDDDDSDDSDGPEDIRKTAKAPSGPPRPPAGGNVPNKVTGKGDSDDDSDSDGPVDIRKVGAAPSGAPRPPTGGAAISRHESSSGSESSGDDSSEQRKQAALEQYRREEAEEKAREMRSQSQKAIAAAKQMQEAASTIADDMNDSDTISPPSKGSCSGLAPVVKKNATPPSDLDATMKDKKFKEKVKVYSTRFAAGYADTVGKRSTMEDKLAIVGCFGDNVDCDYFAVFDGHGNVAAAAHCNKSLHKCMIDALGQSSEYASLDASKVGEACKKAFLACQADVEKEEIEGGTTALVALALGRQLFIANLGDCRAVLVDKAGKALRASYDHKAHDAIEEARITAAGGHVQKSRVDGHLVSRVNGMLAVSRSIGDNSLRKFLTSEPQMHGPYKLDDFQALILACDGVWDVVSDGTAARLASSSIKEPEQAAIKIRDKAFTRGSKDNISVLVVQLQK